MTRFLAAVLALFILLGAHQARAADCANPTRSEGTTVYNASAHVMQYCDGTEWVGMGPKPYIPVTVTFDGTNDYLLRGGDLSSVSDDKEATGAFWFRRTGGTGAIRVIYSNTNARFEISFTAANVLRILGKNASNTTILDISTTAAYTDASWHHVLFSFDLTDPSRRFIYVDSAAQALTITTFANDTIDFTTGDVSVGATTAGGTTYMGDMADFWLETGLYLDLSAAITRQKFISATVKPVSLGSTGAGPTGAQPDVFLSGPLASWHTNDGTGGGFNLTGSLTAAAEPPGSSISDVTSGMYSRWTLDQTSGATLNDSVGNDNLTWVDGTGNSVAEESLPGKINTAIDFVSSDYATVNYDDGALDNLAALSACSWFYSDANQTGKAIFRWVNQAFNSPMLRLRVTGNSGQIEGLVWLSGEGSPHTATSVGQGNGYWNNAWHHACVVFDKSLSSNRLKLYVDGAQVAQHDAVNQNLEFNTSGISGLMEIARDNQSGTYFDGKIDDVRLYTRALSAEEVGQIYARAAGCLNPVRAEGEMFYNATTTAMQYCNGVDWVTMGRAPTGYTANGVTFDGTNDYMAVSNVLGAANGKTMTGSFWVRRNSLGQQIIYRLNTTNTASAANLRFLIEFDSANKLHIVGSSTAPADVMSVTTAAVFSDYGWHHVMYSFDDAVASCGTSRIYIDGVQDAASWSCSNTNINFNAATPRSSFGAEHLGGGSKFNGDVADFWFDIGTFTDLTNAANRAKFLTTAGKPVDLGTTGTIPTGAAVEAFFHDITPTWHTNDSGAAGFTLLGALTDAAVDPGTCGQAGPLVEVGNISTAGSAGSIWFDGTYIYVANYWEAEVRAYTFNGTSFTLKGTYAAPNWIEGGPWGDGTYIYVGGGFGVHALTFNGSSFSLAGSHAGTVEGIWGDGTYIYEGQGGNDLHAYTFNGTTFTEVGSIVTVDTAKDVWGDGAYIYVADYGGGLRAYTYSAGVFTLAGSWTGMDQARGVWGDGTYVYANDGTDGIAAFTFDGSTFTLKGSPGVGGNIWGDGTYLYVAIGASGIRAYTFDGTSFSLVSSYDTPGLAVATWSDGTYLYVTDESAGGLRAYSGFGGCRCQNPDRVAGTMVYNNDYNVMQYCAGVSWRRVGK